MKKWKVSLLVAAMALIYACGGTSSGKVLVEINGDKITEGYLKFLGEINPRIQSQLDNPAGQKRILDNLVEQELLYQEAVKEGINRDPKVKEKVDLYRRVIIAQSLIDAETDKAAKKYYDEHQDEFKQLKLSHIMVRFATPEEIKKEKKGENLLSEDAALKKAEELKARIEKGEDFATVASEASDDAATKTRGGDLGLVSKDDKRLESRGFGPLLAKAFDLKVGEVAGPIKTDKGYHLIVVTRGMELTPFDEAKQGILFKVRGDLRNDLLARLKKDAKIVYPQDEKAKADAAKKSDAQAKPGEPAKLNAPTAPAAPAAPAADAQPEAGKPQADAQPAADKPADDAKKPADAAKVDKPADQAKDADKKAN